VPCKRAGLQLGLRRRLVRGGVLGLRFMQKGNLLGLRGGEDDAFRILTKAHVEGEKRIGGASATHVAWPRCRSPAGGAGEAV